MLLQNARNRPIYIEKYSLVLYIMKQKFVVKVDYLLYQIHAMDWIGRPYMYLCFLMFYLSIYLEKRVVPHKKQCIHSDTHSHSLRTTFSACNTCKRDPMYTLDSREWSTQIILCKQVFGWGKVKALQFCKETGQYNKLNTVWRCSYSCMNSYHIFINRNKAVKTLQQKLKIQVEAGDFL